MRIAFVSDNAYPWFNGGIEKRRFIIMQGLAESGNEVHCFTTFRKGMPGKEFDYGGIKYHCFDSAEGWQGMYTGGGKRRSITRPLSFSFLLFFKILPYKFDLVDADSFPFLHLLPLYIYKLLRRTRLVVTWHEVWSKAFWEEYLNRLGVIGYSVEKVCTKIPDMHIANSTTTKMLLEKEFGVQSRHILILPAAVDKNEIEKFVSKNRYVKKNRFVVINRLVKHKRVELAIKAMRNVKAQLVVIGTGPEREMLEKTAQEYARGKVEFKHNLSPHMLFKEICEAKALVMPSEREGLSLVTVESMALGTPVVILDTSALPDELRRLCIETRESRLAETLNKLVNNYKAYEKKYRGMRGAVIREFSGEKADEVYERILRGV